MIVVRRALSVICTLCSMIMAAIILLLLIAVIVTGGFGEWQLWVAFAVLAIVSAFFGVLAAFVWPKVRHYPDPEIFS
ncbi:MAG: hypothetical protein ABSD80_06210 [Caulobacteraceae bacterium]